MKSPEILPSALTFKLPDNNNNVFCGGINDWVETANSSNFELLQTLFLLNKRKLLIIVYIMKGINY